MGIVPLTRKPCRASCVRPALNTVSDFSIASLAFLKLGFSAGEAEALGTTIAAPRRIADGHAVHLSGGSSRKEQVHCPQTCCKRSSVSIFVQMSK